MDPGMAWLRQVVMRKPVSHWVEQLFRDDSAAAHGDALLGLAELPMPHERFSVLPCRALSQCLRGRVSHTQVEHAACVRAEAATALAVWQNLHAPRTAAVATGVGDSWRGLNLLFRAFAERFESSPAGLAAANGCAGGGGGGGGSGGGGGGDGAVGSSVLLPNWFDDPAEYALKKAMVWAVANIRALNGCSPPEVCAFLTRLLRENDNSENYTPADSRPPRGPAFVDDYYIAGVLVALGQASTAREAGLSEGMLAAATAEARRWLEWGCLRGSHNGVVAAAALHCLCELELAAGGVPATPHARYAAGRFPLGVRVVAIQNVVRQYLAMDTHTDMGLSAALRWVLRLAESERDERVREAAVLVALDCLERRPPRAAHRARFWSDDTLHGSGDPWCSREFYAPRGPGRVAYRADRPLPRDFPGAAEVAESAWQLLCGGTAFNQPLRTLVLQLYRDLWGNAVPPALAAAAAAAAAAGRPSVPPAPKPESWRGIYAVVASTVRPWVIHRARRRDWIDRDWLAWRRRRLNSEGDSGDRPRPGDPGFGERRGGSGIREDENYGPTKEEAERWEEHAATAEAAKRQKLIIRLPGLRAPVRPAGNA
ncbi:unnamed protein product [Phaeothamnion confervicola]